MFFRDFLAAPLKDKVISPSNLNEDGRINSLIDEKTIISRFIEFYGAGCVLEPKSRYWCDVLFHFDGAWRPVQIKCSRGGKDNWSSTRALLYACTDLSIGEIDDHSNKPGEIQRTLQKRKHLNTGRDMQILFFHKKTGEFHFPTLKTLGSLCSNGSNLPFQVNWKKFLRDGPTHRSNSDAIEYILNMYRESIFKQRAMHDDGFVNQDTGCLHV